MKINTKTTFIFKGEHCVCFKLRDGKNEKVKMYDYKL